MGPILTGFAIGTNELDEVRDTNTRIPRHEGGLLLAKERQGYIEMGLYIAGFGDSYSGRVPEIGIEADLFGNAGIIMRDSQGEEAVFFSIGEFNISSP